MQLILLSVGRGDDLSVRVGRKFCAEPEGSVSGIGGPSIRWHESSFNGSLQPYTICVPSSYDPSRPWPLVISLHGYSTDHVLNLKRVFGRGNASGEPDDVAKAYFTQMPEVDFIVVSPYGFGSMWYEGCSEVDVLDVLADVRENYNIDPDRIYLTGLSMGGYGTWRLAERYPDLFAAIAPVCAPISSWHTTYLYPELPAFATDLVAAGSPVALARNLSHMPVKVFHGAEDDAVCVNNSREMVHRLRDVGAEVEYVEYPEVRHNAWEFAYADASIFDWFRQYKRDSRPLSIDFSTPSLRWSSAYWLRVLQITKRPYPADIKAVISDNVVRVTSQNVQAFALTLDKMPFEVCAPLTVLWNGAEAFHGVVESSELVFGNMEFGLMKRAGLEGPVTDAFSERYMLVYGTSGNNSDVVRASRAAAESMADMGEWGDVEVPIKPDWDVTNDDIEAFSLILIGNQESNDLIARINADLPVRFESDCIRAGRRFYTRRDLGMILIHPNPLNPNKYVVVLGGQSATTIKMASDHCRYAPDYVIFDSTTDFTASATIRDYGYFNNSWTFGENHR